MITIPIQKKLLNPLNNKLNANKKHLRLILLEKADYINGNGFHLEVFFDNTTLKTV